MAEKLHFELNDIWSEHDHVGTQRALLLALSGGVDSLSLWHWLIHGGVQPAERVTAAYVNHHLREDADRDVVQLRQLADAWGTPLVVLDADVPAVAARDKLSLEAAGRQARYRLLGRLATEIGARFILTGHHADDQVETILLNLLRGTGLRGLRGMSHFAPLPLAGHKRSEGELLELFRPMLSLHRSDIERYAAYHQLKPLEDETNRESKFTRNRVRHELVPLLETYNPNVRAGLLQMGRLLADDYAALSAGVDEVWSASLKESDERWVVLDRAIWSAQHRSLQRALIRKIFAHLTGGLTDLSADVVDLACHTLLHGAHGAIAELGRGVELWLHYDETIVGVLGQPDTLFNQPQLPVEHIDIEINYPAHYLLSDRWVMAVRPAKLTEIDWSTPAEDRYLAYIGLRADAILFLRGRITGERFQPFGMDGRTGLKRLMVDRKMPALLRDRWPLLADEIGLLWVPGHRLAARAAVDQTGVDTTQIIIEVKLFCRET